MKKTQLNFAPFKSYDGKGLVFIKPLRSKIYRLYGLKGWGTAQVWNFIMDTGAKYRGGIYVFPKKDEDEMNLICLNLSAMGVPAAALEIDKQTCN
jgi:hypothetical protein